MNAASCVEPAHPRLWIDNLPRDVAAQAAVLRRLLDAVEADPRIRAFRVRGSIARGTADALSDLDTRIWISDDDYAAVLPELPALVRSLGPTLDVLFETPGSPYLFTQFKDGVQLELSTACVSEGIDLDYGVVVLLDRDRLWERPSNPESPWDQDLWLGWAWMALYDVDKHLRRGSLWEALIALEKARSLLLRHHAAATGMTDPEFGLTSLLDYGGDLPEGLGETAARLDAGEIRQAAIACSRLLGAYGQRPFASHVVARLTARG